VIPIEIPPLRERREDIPALVEHFVRKHAPAHRAAASTDDDGGLAGAAAVRLAGNVRELENTIERAVVLSPGR
jgi:two-component system response regulator AtoC/two-component system response regulator HupR/HoxA